MPQFKEAVAAAGRPGGAAGYRAAIRAGANWALVLRGARRAQAARRPRPGARAGASRISTSSRPGRCISRSNIFSRVEPRPPVGAPVGGRQGLVARQSVLAAALPRLLRAPRRARRRRRFRPGARTRASASPPADHPGISRARESSVRGGADRASSTTSSAAASTATFLTTFGRFWSDSSEPRFPDRARGLAQPLGDRRSDAGADAAALAAGQRRAAGRQDLVPAASRARVCAEGWTVFEASGADLMAGQQWFGQLEGRIRQAVDELTVDKKLIWYIPDLLQLARSGTHQGQSASILDQILPAIVAGRLVIWSEATPTERRAPAAAAPVAAQHLRGGAARAAVRGRDAVARARGHAAAGGAGGIADRSGLRRGRGRLRAPISRRRGLSGLGAAAASSSRGRAEQGQRRDRAARRARDAVAAHRPAGLDPRHQRAHRSRRRSATSSRAA